MTKTFRIIGLSMLATAAVAMAATAGLSVKRTPKVGDTVKFRMKADVDFSGQQVTVNALMEEKVTKVDADGSYAVEQKQLEGKVNVGGQEMELPNAGGTTTTSFLASGLIKEIKGDSTSDAAYRMANLNAIIDQGKEVAVGDTWTTEFKADSKTGAVAAKGEFKILAEEKVGEWDTIKIKATVTETEGASPASSDGTVWISKKDGSMVKLDVKWTNAPFPGAPMPINASVVMTRE